MNLDKNYRLISDDYNFILQRKVPLRRNRHGHLELELLQGRQELAWTMSLLVAHNNLPCERAFGISKGG